MKKLISIFLVLGVLGSALVGCGKAEEAAPDAAATTGGAAAPAAGEEAK